METLSRFLTVALVMIVMLMAAACSGGAAGPASTATLEGGYRQLPPETIAAGETRAAESEQQLTLQPCKRRELEDWLQRSGSLVFEYAQEVNNNLATPPDQMAGVIEQLGTLRGALQDITPPPCAVDHYDMIMGMMLRATEALTNYALGQGLDLVAFATESNTAVDQIRIREEQLAALYNSLPRD